MKIIHGGGFVEKERMKAKEIIIQNIFIGIISLVNATEPLKLCIDESKKVKKLQKSLATCKCYRDTFKNPE